MKKYEIISFDMFQTLVDVNQRIPDIWRNILEEEYTEEKGLLGAKAVLGYLSTAYQNAVSPFRNMEEMYVACARYTIEQTGFKVTPEKIAHVIMFQHGFAPFYEEILEVINHLKQSYTVILSSDSNHLMVDPLLNQLKVDRAFISDDMRCYKGEPTGRFFKVVLEEMKVSPDKILHIGDSSADILGAHAAKVDACWINREGREWTHEDKPDYVISNLRDIVCTCLS